MSIFKKKRSLEDIEKDISELSEEERTALLDKLQVSNKSEEAVETEAPAEESVVEEKTEESEAVEEISETEEESNETVEMPEEQTEEQVEEMQATEEPVEESVQNSESPVEETPAEQPNNYDELFQAQNAKISSLESEIKALRETVEKVVANQDNKNFGYSPKANFSEEEQSSRSEAIMRGYAPRRVENYK